MPDGRANPNQTLATPENRAGLAALLDELQRRTPRALRRHVRPVGRLATDAFGPLLPAERPRSSSRGSLIIIRCSTPSSASTRATRRVVMTDDELERLIDAYVAAAGLARDVGFQFVDIKACHGYLLHEFLERPHAARADSAATSPAARGC